MKHGFHPPRVPLLRLALAIPFTGVLLLGQATPALAETATARAPAVDLRPVDRATVRIISVRGAKLSLGRGRRSGRLWALVSPSFGHGSGVVVERRGLIATARHVVEGSDFLAVVFPGENRARPARVVSLDSERDLAFVAVAGQAPAAVPLPSKAPPLRASQEISVSGYPIELRERYPAAASGQIGRALNGGLLQLSMSLNPGNSGGPVVDSSGRLVGIITARGDPAEGVLGVAIAEPVSALIELHSREARAAYQRLREESVDPGLTEIAQVISWVLQDESTPGASEEELSSVLDSWDRLVATEGQVDAGICAFLAATAYAAWAHAHEAVGGVDGALPAEVAATVGRLERAGRNLARRALLADPGIRTRYSAMDLLANDTWDLPRDELASSGPGATVPAQPALLACGQEGTPCCGGRCAAGLSCGGGVCRVPVPCRSSAQCGGGQQCFAGLCTEPAPRDLLRLDFDTGLVMDGGSEQSGEPAPASASGGVFGVTLHGHLWEVGERMPYRLTFLAGGSCALGWWRSHLLARLTADLGMRLTLGTPRIAATVTLVYGLGYARAEERDTFVYASYLASVGLILRSFGVALSYGEVGRGADDPLRTLSFHMEWSI